jgi:hypothetical protein
VYGNDPPPPYSSGGSTASLSPEPSSSEERRQLSRELDRTRPDAQFNREAREEKKLIAVRDGFLSGLLGPHTKLAEDIVRERWIERGIWKWGPGSRAGELWKHEEADAGLYQTEPEKMQPPNSLFGNPPANVRAMLHEHEKPTLPPNINASRPCNQFEYDLTIERKRLKAGKAPDGLPDMVYKRVKDKWTERGIWDPRYTQQPEYDLAKEGHWLWARERNKFPESRLQAEEMAYENVKDKWIKQGRWDSRWTDRPGKIWRHERPEEKARLRQLGGLADRGAPNPFTRQFLGLPPLPGASSPHRQNPLQTSDYSQTRSSNSSPQAQPNTSVDQSATNQQPTFSPGTTHRSRRPLLGPVEPSRVSKLNGKPKRRRQTNAALKLVTSERPLTKAHNVPGKRSSPVDIQPPVTASVPWRSARIAERMRKAEGISERSSRAKMPGRKCQGENARAKMPGRNGSRLRSSSPAEAQPPVPASVPRKSAQRSEQMRKAEGVSEQISKAETAVRRKRKTAESLANESNGRSKSKRRNALIAADSYRIRKGQKGAKAERRARSQ